MDKFSSLDYWKAIILYGLNNATYKIALGKTLLDLSNSSNAAISWETLSKSFLDQYIERLTKESTLPQQTNPVRLTVMERIVHGLRNGNITYGEAVERVGGEAFHDVIPRFQTIGTNKELVKSKFYEFEFGKRLVLKDDLFLLQEQEVTALYDELEARWSLLEGAFLINRTQASLNNDLREIYLQGSYARTNLTGNIPFLMGYQGGVCFYCGEELKAGDIHVDHVLPRQVVNHDEIWNLVLTHGYCNESKSDRLVADYYVQKLIARNENIMGSNHPWKQKIERALGATPKGRAKSFQQHYDNVKRILGAYYWGGMTHYVPEHDPFYRKLITRLNNG